MLSRAGGQMVPSTAMYRSSPAVNSRPVLLGLQADGSL
jgi:hypothetical protein